MLLVAKTGWIMAVVVNKKTRYGTHVTTLDNNRARFVSLKETKHKLVETMAEALAFINAKNNG